jgi:hypothetical protein
MLYRSISMTIGLALAFAIACDGGEKVPEDRGLYTAERGLGKADSTQTCKASCGKQSPGGCWCDSQCASYGDCCADKAAECDTTTPTPTPTKGCEGFCGKKSSEGCWCDSQCSKYGDCCSNKVAVCDGTPTPDPEPDPEPDPDPVLPACYKAGCSGQVCTDNQFLTTTCEWKSWYVCLPAAGCGNNGPNGSCAWEITADLIQCLKDNGLQF